jgi:hypothetical protein
MELTDCSFRMTVVWHLNKSKPTILPEHNVIPNPRVLNRAVLREQAFQFILRDVTIKVRYEDLHCSSYFFRKLLDRIIGLSAAPKGGLNRRSDRLTSSVLEQFAHRPPNWPLCLFACHAVS